MPASVAFLIGSLNAFRSMSATAMPSTFAEIAEFIALTISVTLLFCDPVHWYVVPTRPLASDAPYWVGVKNGFVVTWLTKVNRYFLVDGKLPGPPPLLPPLLEAPHAASAAASTPLPPAIADRRRSVLRRMLQNAASSIDPSGRPSG